MFDKEPPMVGEERPSSTDRTFPERAPMLWSTSGRCLRVGFLSSWWRRFVCSL